MEHLIINTDTETVKGEKLEVSDWTAGPDDSDDDDESEADSETTE